RLADEDQEGGLEGVLGVVVIAEDPAAHGPDHRAMPAHQGGQRRLVPAAEVVLQQLPIGQARPTPQKHGPAQVLEDLARLACRHVVSLGEAKLAFYLTTTRTGLFDPLFWLRLAGGRLTSRCGRRRPRLRLLGV